MITKLVILCNKLCLWMKYACQVMLIADKDDNYFEEKKSWDEDKNSKKVVNLETDFNSCYQCIALCSILVKFFKRQNTNARVRTCELQFQTKISCEISDHLILYVNRIVFIRTSTFLHLANYNIDETENWIWWRSFSWYG